MNTMRLEAGLQVEMLGFDLVKGQCQWRNYLNFLKRDSNLYARHIIRKKVNIEICAKSEKLKIRTTYFRNIVKSQFKQILISTQFHVFWFFIWIFWDKILLGHFITFAYSMCSKNGTFSENVEKNYKIIACIAIILRLIPIKIHKKNNLSPLVYK